MDDPSDTSVFVKKRPGPKPKSDCVVAVRLSEAANQFFTALAARKNTTKGMLAAFVLNEYIRTEAEKQLPPAQAEDVLRILATVDPTVLSVLGHGKFDAPPA